MKKFEVQVTLEGIAEARAAWATANAKFNADVEFLMNRLINEAAANFMSAEEVAKASGLTVKRVKTMMRERGLDPKRGKQLLAKQAAEALAENSALLGIEPHEMDLMSPLAYLPMGDQMREALRPKGVTEIPETREEKIDRLADVVYGVLPMEGELYQSLAENIAAAVVDSTETGE